MDINLLSKNVLQESVKGAVKSKGNRVVMFRTYHPTYTSSDLFAYKNGKLELELKTIELPWKNNKQYISCVMEGIYNVVYRGSEKYKQHYHIKNVPGRSYILFHPFNYVFGNKVDSLGCIAPCLSLADINSDGYVDGVSSGKAMNRLLQLYKKDGFKLIILEK